MLTPLPLTVGKAAGFSISVASAFRSFGLLSERHEADPGTGSGNAMHRFWHASGKEFCIDQLRRLTLDALPTAVVLADADLPETPLVYVNPAFERLTGYSSDEVLGRNCRFLAGPETSIEQRAAIRAALSENREFRGLVRNYRRDGAPFWNDLTITPIADADGRYFVGVQSDVSERLVLEANLREAQKMEALGKLSGGIAHDFNNILALIVGNAELLAAEAEGLPEVREAVADILDAAEGGAALVQRMLHFARGDQNPAETISVNRAIRDALSLLSRTVGDRVQFRIDLSDVVGQVRADRAMFESALINLVLNARDSMPRGGTVTISTRRRLDAAPAIEMAAVITVSDQGCGMSDETRRRAFEPFFTTKEGGRGTGLGLSMVYRFVQQSGGLIAIQSAPDEGTTIELVLPMVDEDAPTLTSDENKMVWPRVLVVEDDPRVRRVLAIQLQRARYVVDEAATAAEAEALLRAERRPDLIISDIRLGSGANGIELVASARAIIPGIPVLLITGFSDELENPPDHINGVPILRKPFRTKALLQAVEGVLSEIAIVR